MQTQGCLSALGPVLTPCPAHALAWARSSKSKCADPGLSQCPWTRADPLPCACASLGAIHKKQVCNVGHLPRLCASPPPPPAATGLSPALLLPLLFERCLHFSTINPPMSLFRDEPVHRGRCSPLSRQHRPVCSLQEPSYFSSNRWLVGPPVAPIFRYFRHRKERESTHSGMAAFSLPTGSSQLSSVKMTSLQLSSSPFRLW